MSEKYIGLFEEKAHEKQTIDRRSYLKLASAAGTGLGTGLGASVLEERVVVHLL